MECNVAALVKAKNVAMYYIISYDPLESCVFHGTKFVTKRLKVWAEVKMILYSRNFSFSEGASVLFQYTAV